MLTPLLRAGSQVLNRSTGQDPGNLDGLPMVIVCSMFMAWSESGSDVVVDKYIGSQFLPVQLLNLMSTCRKAIMRSNHPHIRC